MAVGRGLHKGVNARRRGTILEAAYSEETQALVLSPSLTICFGPVIDPLSPQL